ncbi:MAG: outer membrane lipoprotein-sorting protein [Rhodothermales bacterium]
MQNIKPIRFLAIALVVVAFAKGTPATAQELSGQEIARKARQAFYYAGDDIKARVLMKLISERGKERTRELTMLRLDNGDAEEQKYYMYFHRPADVRAMAFMVWKYPGKDDDRWLYVPAIKLVQRIAADDKNSSFVGSDFSYEDVSGRTLEDDTHSLLREEMLDGTPAYVLESVPREAKSAYYSRKVAWIDKDTFLPLKEEYYDGRGTLYKTFTAEQIEEIQGIPTIMKRTMTNVQNGHRTEVTFPEVKYNVGLKDNLFSERYLRNAPREWVQ